MVLSAARRPHAEDAAPVDDRARAHGNATSAPTPAPTPGGRVVTRVLVVDDEPQILRALAINLRARALRGRHGRHRRGGARGRRRAPARPGHPRPRAARHRRRRGHPRPAGLDHGADHHPLRPHRQRRQGRRRSTPAPTTTSPSRSAWTSCWPGCGPSSRRAAPATTCSPSCVRPTHRRPGRPTGDRADGDRVDVRLTPTEWHLLEVLLRNPGKLLSQASCSQEVWGPGYETAERQPARLHGPAAPEAGADPARPRHLLTEPGMGYRFQPEERRVGAVTDLTFWAIGEGPNGLDVPSAHTTSPLGGRGHAGPVEASAPRAKAAVASMSAAHQVGPDDRDRGDSSGSARSGVDDVGSAVRQPGRGHRSVPDRDDGDDRCGVVRVLDADPPAGRAGARCGRPCHHRPRGRRRCRAGSRGRRRRDPRPSPSPRRWGPGPGRRPGQGVVRRTRHRTARARSPSSRTSRTSSGQSSIVSSPRASRETAESSR